MIMHFYRNLWSLPRNPAPPPVALFIISSEFLARDFILFFADYIYSGGRIRMYLATLSLFIYIFTKISADLYAGSLFLTLSIPELNIYLAVIILLAITVVYAIAGGLKVLGWSLYDANLGRFSF